jgi:hypothetical protein
MSNLYVQETFVNKTEGYQFGESDVYESGYDDKGKLYRALRRKYGRCVSRVYVDSSQGAKSIGWVFVKRDKYDDTGDSYLREVWVTLHDAPPTKTIEYHYAS